MNIINKQIVTQKIICKWCTLNDISMLDTLVELFVRNVNKQYISHGEVIDGRANNMNEWKLEIKEIMREEFAEAMNSSFDISHTFSKLCILTQEENIVALALVVFYPQTKIAILSDIVVDEPFRGQKIGEAMFHWIETEAKLWGAKSIFLESGLQNKSAHHFFENMGFMTTSVVMIKDI